MRLFLAPVVVAAAASPCFADGVYIGRTSAGPDTARIAIVEAGGRYVCYSCSGDAAFNEKYSRWMQGAVNAKGESTASSGGVFLHATFAKSSVRGGLQTADGESVEFHASKVADDAEAGLFRYVQLTDDERVIDGWIVDQEGDVVGQRNKTARKAIGKGPRDQKRQGVGRTARGADDKKPAGAALGAGGVAGASSSKKKQPIVSSKKLGDRLSSVAKKKAEAGANADGAQGTAKKGTSKTGIAGRVPKVGTDKTAGAKGEKKPAGTNKADPGNEQVAAGGKTGTKKQGTEGEKKGTNEKTAVAEKTGTKGKGKGEEGAKGKVAAGAKKKGGKVEVPEEDGAAGKIAGVGKKQGQKGQNAGQKQQGAQAGAEENAAAAEAAEAAEENQPEVAVNAGKQKQKQQGQQGQQPVGKIRNVEEINIIEQEEEEAAEVEEVAAPQEVDVENVRIVNRIKPNNQQNAGQQKQNNNAPAPLPGEVVEGTLVGVDDEDRVLTLDDGQDVVEVPIGNRQMIVIDENGERAAEATENAAAQGALKGKPGEMLKKLAASGDVAVRVRIGAKNVVVKQQAEEE